MVGDTRCSGGDRYETAISPFSTSREGSGSAIRIQGHREQSLNFPTQAFHYLKTVESPRGESSFWRRRNRIPFDELMCNHVVDDDAGVPFLATNTPEQQIQ